MLLSQSEKTPYFIKESKKQGWRVWIKDSNHYTKKVKHDYRKIAATVRRERTGASSFLLLIIVLLISALVYWSAVTQIDKVSSGQRKSFRHSRGTL